MNSEIKDKKDVIQIPILPGTTSGGMKTEAAEAMQSIILGINVCSQWLVAILCNSKWILMPENGARNYTELVIWGNGILFPTLFWPTMRKNCSIDQEKLLKLEAEGQEFAKILRSQEQFIQSVEGQNNFR